MDAELCADVTKLDGMGDARVAAAAKEIAYRLDAQAVVDRAAKAEADRTVTIRPAPDTMTYVTALLPVAQGVGVYAALKRAADTTFDDRSRGQVMADTLVERVTGRPAESAAAGGGEPGDVGSGAVGRGQCTGGARRVRADPGGGGAAVWSTERCADERSLATLRRLYRAPEERVVGGDGVAVAAAFPRGWPASSGCGINVSHAVL